MTVPPPRDPSERKTHVLELLDSELDAWVATADAEGAVCQIPLSFAWSDGRLTFSTPTESITGRNLAASGTIRIALGSTRDVVLIVGAVESYSGSEVPAASADAFAAKHDWDPRRESGRAYAYFLVTPTRVQAWREENELKGRTLMRDGRWLV